MKRSGWICLIMLIGIILIGGGIVWWWQRSRSERIVLSDLPRLKPLEPDRHASAGRRDGRPLQIRTISNPPPGAA